MASGSMKDIKRRIKTIESTKQITKAMELVSSSKLKRAKERAQSAAPYFETLYETITDISTMDTGVSSIYTVKREVKNSLFIVIAGDRGLAGGYNGNIIKLANRDMKDKNVQVIGIGKKAVDYYEKTGQLHKGFFNVAENMSNMMVREIANIVISLYQKGEVDEIVLYYTQFVTALNQQPLNLKILPLDFQVSGDRNSRNTAIYEPSPSAVFEIIIPEYVSGMIYGGVVESFACEQASRRTAMENATDNATDMIDNLLLIYNRARQASITQEISEIVSGASAL